MLSCTPACSGCIACDLGATLGRELLCSGLSPLACSTLGKLISIVLTAVFGRHRSAASACAVAQGIETDWPLAAPMTGNHQIRRRCAALLPRCRRLLDVVDPLMGDEQSAAELDRGAVVREVLHAREENAAGPVLGSRDHFLEEPTVGPLVPMHVHHDELARDPLPPIERPRGGHLATSELGEHEEEGEATEEAPPETAHPRPGCRRSCRLGPDPLEAAGTRSGASRCASRCRRSVSAVASSS